MSSLHSNSSTLTSTSRFLINHLKSKLTLENKFQWLGISWNTTRATISLPGEKTYLQESCQVIHQITLSHSKDVREGHRRAPLCIHSGPDKENHSKIHRLIHYPKSQKGQETDMLLHNPLPLCKALRRWLSVVLFLKVATMIEEIWQQWKAIVSCCCHVFGGEGTHVAYERTGMKCCLKSWSISWSSCC